MTNFYNRYRALFEEDGFSSNLSLNYFSGKSKIYPDKFNNLFKDINYSIPAPKVYQSPIQDVYTLETKKFQYSPVQPPTINVLSSLKKAHSKVNRLDPNELNKLIDSYNDDTKLAKQFPSFPTIKELRRVEEPVYEYKRKDSVLKNVYQQILPNKNNEIKNYYEQLERGIAMKNNRGAEDAETKGNFVKEVPLKETYKPEALVSYVPTSEKIFPHLEKDNEDSGEYAFLKRQREARKHREKAKKMLRVIYFPNSSIG